jgi:hypothetical protein
MSRDTCCSGCWVLQLLNDFVLHHASSPQLLQMGALTPYHLRVWSRSRVFKFHSGSLKKHFVQSNIPVTLQVCACVCYLSQLAVLLSVWLVDSTDV